MYKLLVILLFFVSSGYAQESLIDFKEPSNNLNNIETRNNNNQFCSGNLLLDQTPNASNGFFNDLDCDNCGTGVQVIAENFNLPTNNDLGQFVIYTGYFPGNVPITDTWTLTIHDDNAGLPGNVIYTETSVASTRTDTGVDLFGVDQYRVVLTPTSAIALTAGTYWVEIHNDSTGSSDSVFWEVGDADTNSLAQSAASTVYPNPVWSVTTLGGNDIDNFALQICQEAFDLDVNVTGLAATNTVSVLNGKDLVPVSNNGITTISRISDATAYSLSIDQQPDTPDQVCTITSSNASGSMTASGVTVDINCVTTQYDVEINVSGLAASNSVSFANGADSVTFNTDGTQTISTLDDESAFNVTITSQPDTPDQVCTFDNANAGNLAGGNATINVTCTTTPYDVVLNVTGLAATNSVSFANGADTAAFNTDGTQILSTLPDGSAYNVSITAQPDTPNQVCAFDDSNSGNLAGGDVTINVTCVTTQYDININVTGLINTNTLSFANGLDTIDFNSDATQTISTLDDQSAFDVDITAQPDTPDQVCSFDNADSGTLAGSDVTVNVSCVTTQYTVGVDVSGLAPGNSVTLQNNAGDDLTINDNVIGTFATALDDGSAYDVTVLTQPTSPNQTCVVAAASGNLNGSNINLTVTCTTDQYNVNVNVTGLANGNSVSFSNGGDTLTLTTNASDIISTLADESNYDVDITIQPTAPNQVCGFDNADSGTLAGSDVTVNVSCVTAQYTVGVDVSGLAPGNSVTLQNNAGDDLTINDNVIGTFATALDDGSAYDVTVLTQPTSPNQTCVVSSSSGILNGSNVNLNVSCTTTQYDVIINVSGLAATNTVSFANGVDTLDLSSNTSGVISTLADESAFDVSVTAQPDTPNQVCTFTSSNSGNLAGGDVTVNVNCVTTQYTIAVNVAGLDTGNTVVVQNNGADNLTASTNGISTFATALDDGSAYNVTVLSQPTSPNQTCVVSDPSGNLNGADVSINVNCTTNPYNIAVNVTGLAAGNSVIFQNNGGDDLSVNTNTTATFATALDDGSAYAVTVLTQPSSPNQTCTITDGTGNLAGDDVTIDVACTTEQYTISINTSGLGVGNDVVLQNNGGDDLTISTNGTSTFATALDDESSYLITVLTQPTTPNQSCVLANENGTLAGADVTDVTLTCTTEQYDISLNVQGLVATNSVSFANDTDSATFNADGTQTISTLDDGSAYAISITAQPDTPVQACVFDDPATGNLEGNDVTINVSCSITQYTVGVNVSGLAPSNTVVLQNNGGDNLTISSNGPSTFATALDDETDYEVSIIIQPVSPNQTCSVADGSGTIAGADVTDVTVNCVTEQYFVGGVLTGMLSVNDLLLDNNGQETELVQCNGPFVFSTPLDDLSTYSVTELMDPDSPFQDCEVTMGDGTVDGDDVIDIAVFCAATTDTDYIFGEGFDCPIFPPQ